MAVDLRIKTSRKTLKTVALTVLLYVMMILGQNATAATATPVVTPARITQLELTHALFTTTLRYYLVDRTGEYNPVAQARREYLITFLNEWAYMIRSGKYNSSSQIFETIKNRNSFLGKHYAIWQRLIDPHFQGGERIPFPYTVGSSFYAFLQSEQETTLAKQVAKSLLNVRDWILVNGRNEELAMHLALPFENSEDPGVSQSLQILKENVGVARFAAFAVAARDITLGGIALKSSLGLLTSGAAMTSTGAATASTGVPSWAAGTASAATASSNFSPIYGGIGISALLHGAIGSEICGYPNCLSSSDGVQNKNNFKTQEMPPEKVPLEISTVLLWENAERITGKYPEVDSFHSTRDFKITSAPLPQDTVIHYLQRALVGEYLIDPMELIINAERLMGLDQRDSNDTLAFDFAIHNARRVARKLQKLNTHVLEENDLADVRRILMDNLLRYYRKNETSALSVFLNWGGNCQSRATITLMMLPQMQKAFSNRNGFGFVTTPDHVEPIYYNTEENYTIVDGQFRKREAYTLVSGKFAENVSFYRRNAIFVLYLEKLGITAKIDNYLAIRGTPTTARPASPSGIWFAMIHPQNGANLYDSPQIRLTAGFDNSSSPMWRPFGGEVPDVAISSSPGNSRGDTSSIVSGAISATPENNRGTNGEYSNSIKSEAWRPMAVYNSKAMSALSFGGTIQYLSSNRGDLRYNIRIETPSPLIFRNMMKMAYNRTNEKETYRYLMHILIEELNRVDELGSQIEAGTLKIPESLDLEALCWRILINIRNVATVLRIDTDPSITPRGDVSFAEMLVKANKRLSVRIRHANAQRPILWVTRYSKRPYDPYIEYPERQGEFDAEAAMDYEQIAKWIRNLKPENLLRGGLNRRCFEERYKTIQLPKASSTIISSASLSDPQQLGFALHREEICQKVKPEEGTAPVGTLVPLTNVDLIRLGISLGEGFHLWTEQTVEAFMKGDFLPRYYVWRNGVQTDTEDLSARNFKIGVSRNILIDSLRTKYGDRPPVIFRRVLAQPTP